MFTTAIAANRHFRAWVVKCVPFCHPQWQTRRLVAPLPATDMNSAAFRKKLEPNRIDLSDSIFTCLATEALTRSFTSLLTASPTILKGNSMHMMNIAKVFAVS
jgi:hypothetical protein